MGVDTKIKISTVIDDMEIVNILKSHFDAISIKIEPSTTSTCCGYINFTLPNGKKRGMFVYRCNESVFPHTSLSLNCDEEAQKIMLKIVKILGGYYCPADCDDKWEVYSGQLDPSNGIPYFVRWSLINGYMEDSNDLDGLKKGMEEWHKINDKN
jgi:hypothetical protein